MTSPLKAANDRRSSSDRARCLPTEGRDRWRFLAEASALLDDADDPEEVFAAMLRVVVPQFADLCVVRLNDDTAANRTHVLLARPEIMQAFADSGTPADGERTESGAPRDGLQHEGMRLGGARFVEIDDGTLRSMARDDAHLATLRALDPTTMIAVPVTTRGRNYGIAYFLTIRASRRRYCHFDVLTASDLVHRLSLALDRAVHQRSLEREIELLRGRDACHERHAGVTNGIRA